MFGVYQYLWFCAVCGSTFTSTILNNEVEREACNLPKGLVNEIKSYRPIVDKIINTVTKGKGKGETYQELAEFVDTFGARLYGTQNLENAIDYMLDKMKSYGLENVHGENVTTPHWIRGSASCQMLEPRNTSIAVLALGGSVGTQTRGIEAEVLVVRTFEELEQANISIAAKGKIVVFNFEFTSYGESVKYRSQGASRAAKHGAIAALIRSVTPFSMYTLHTGHQGYAENVPKIPAISITVEDATMFQRYQNRGQKIKLKLHIQTELQSDVNSRNSVGEITGTEKPERVVLVSGHLDSWDVGVGAMDDGGGAFISWYALALIKTLGLRPRRTMRAVLWTSEEPGLIGAQAYTQVHKKEIIENFTFAMESDEGTFTPLGIQYAAGPLGGCILQEITNLLTTINATQTKSASSVGSDISLWSGIIPMGSLLNANERYFWYHHSDADRMDVLDPDNLDKATALWASVAYIIADLGEEFPNEFKISEKMLRSKWLMKYGKKN